MKYYKKSKTSIIILCFLIFVSIDKAFPQDQNEVISSFEKQVDKFENFFSSKPKLLEKQSYEGFGKVLRGSPTGYIVFYQRFDNYKISYDVRKSDSLVSPYIGYISINYLETTSKKCGDFLSGKSEKSFTTIDLVRQSKDDESCYDRFRVVGKEITRSAKFIFAFQRNKWVFKDVVHGDDNTPHILFWTAFGKPTSGRFYVEDNDFWRELIE